MSRAVLITTHPGLVARLLPVFPAAGMDVVVVGPPTSYLRRSRYVSRFVPIPDESEARARAYRALVDEVLDEDDWVVPGTDDVIWSILDLAPDDSYAARLLPVGTTAGLRALDSKVGMARACREAGVRQPDFRVADHREQVANMAADLGYPVAVKVGRSAAGGGVQVLRSRRDKVRLQSGGRPYLVESWLEGVPVSLDAIFRRGALRCLVAAEGLESIGENGVRVARRYVDLDDDELVAALGHLATHLGLDGFANVSAIRDADGRHHVFEVDMRPNMWHAYLPGVGVDVVDAIAIEPPSADMPPPFTSPLFPLTIRCWSRGWIYAASPQGIRTVPRMLSRRETLSHIHTGDWAMLPGEGLLWFRRLGRHLSQGVTGMRRRTRLPRA